MGLFAASTGCPDSDSDSLTTCWIDSGGDDDDVVVVVVVVLEVIGGKQLPLGWSKLSARKPLFFVFISSIKDSILSPFFLGVLPKLVWGQRSCSASLVFAVVRVSPSKKLAR